MVSHDFWPYLKRVIKLWNIGVFQTKKFTLITLGYCVPYSQGFWITFSRGIPAPSDDIVHNEQFYVLQRFVHWSSSQLLLLLFFCVEFGTACFNVPRAQHWGQRSEKIGPPNCSYCYETSTNISWSRKTLFFCFQLHWVPFKTDPNSIVPGNWHKIRPLH